MEWIKRGVSGRGIVREGKPVAAVGVESVTSPCPLMKSIHSPTPRLAVKSLPFYTGPLCEATMPFTLCLYQRFPAQCGVTYPRARPQFKWRRKRVSYA